MRGVLLVQATRLPGVIKCAVHDQGRKEGGDA